MQTLNITKKYETYSEYKDSSVEWIGKIPKEWEVSSSRGIFNTEKERVGSSFGDYKILSLTLHGVIPKVLDGSGKNPAEYDTYQVIKKDDLVFCLFDYDVTPRTIGYVEENGMLTGAYTRLIPKLETFSKYYYYYFLFLDYKKELLHLCTGLRNSIPKPLFWSMKSPLPDIKIQEKISKYLDEKIENVDQIIGKKQKQIELLKEKRTVVINKVVTKGIDLKADFIDSGIDWIGKIPKGWQIIKFKYIAKYKKGNSPDKFYDIQEVGTLPYLSMEYLRGTSNCTNFVESLNKTISTEEDLILLCDGSNAGEFIKSKLGVVSSTASVIKFIKVFNKDYVFYLAKYLEKYLKDQTNGMGVPHVDSGILLNLPFLLPSQLEQKEIVSYLDIHVNNYNKAISYVEKSIELLQEFKFSLISNVVTGKIKV